MRPTEPRLADFLPSTEEEKALQREKILAWSKHMDESEEDPNDPTWEEIVAVLNESRGPDNQIIP